MSEGRRTEILEHVLDSQTSAIPTFPVESRMVQEGQLFEAEFYPEAAIDDGVRIGLRLNAPGTSISLPYVHLVAWEGSNSVGLCLLDLVEGGVGTTVLGTTITPINHKRYPASLIASSITVLPTNVSVTATTGVIISRSYGGSALYTPVPTNERRQIKWVLDPTKPYTVRLQNLSGGSALMSIRMAWYQLPTAV